jgi:hypothetical protein
MKPRGVEAPPGKAGQQPEASVAWRRGDPACEAYTASAWAVGLSPERGMSWKPTLLKKRKAAPARGDGRARGFHRGRRAGHVREGFPGTWEVPSSPFEKAGRDTGLPRSWPAGGAPLPDGSEQGAHERYRHREGNEVGREGRRDVGVPHSTDEAGEPTEGTPWREGGTGSWTCWRERWRRHRAPQPSQRDFNG